MTSQPDRLEGVHACIFDAYGTLFDFASAAQRCEDAPAEKRAALTALWRDKQLQYTWLRALVLLCHKRWLKFRRVATA